MWASSFQRISFKHLPVSETNKAQFSSNRRASFKEKQVVIDGQALNYLRTGLGRKSLLCFPGALGTVWSHFTPQIEGLSKTFDVIAWEPPGYGRSIPPLRNFTPDFYLKDAKIARKLIQTLKVDRVSILGWSDGGTASLIFCSAYPDCVDKLVVWGANAYVVSEEITGFERIRDLSTWSQKTLAPLVATYGEQELKRLWSSWCDIMLQFHINGGDIGKAAVPSVKCPTLILHGTRDTMLAPEHPQYLLQNMPNAKLHIFPEGKHNVHLKYADEFNRLVTKFLK